MISSLVVPLLYVVLLIFSVQVCAEGHCRCLLPSLLFVHACGGCVVCMFVSTHTCVLVCVYANVRTCVVCLYVHEHMFVYICACARLHVHVHPCLYVHVCVHLCVCM